MKAGKKEKRNKQKRKKERYKEIIDQSIWMIKQIENCAYQKLEEGRSIIFKNVAIGFGMGEGVGRTVGYKKERKIN